ncbi:rhodanese-like domain-containing protein [Mucilaginibacter sp. HMF5004]|uniref:rhodanese-like domain-containing protein n=1 Tax=Mucilaginibacter rivuli TaxID=2857527 RepID=UPI001C5DAAFD|nr:rhodanese-like domain-containing protein [Mucilaginibacter rivuli]MBW4890701.1 rhodanese-like domain-containing protein [Mucilaginibacter rivuli]
MKKKNIITLVLLIATLGIKAQEAHVPYVQKSPNKIVVNTKISANLLAEIAQGKAYLVDVRTPEEYDKQHLKYAQNINIRSADFGTQVKKLGKDKKVYLYCHSGNRSGKATDSLQTLGYTHSYNIGGIDSLIKAGFPAQ